MWVRVRCTMFYGVIFSCHLSFFSWKWKQKKKWIQNCAFRNHIAAKPQLYVHLLSKMDFSKQKKLAWHGIEIGSVHRMCGISHKAIWNNVLELFCLDVVEFLFGSPSSCVAIFVYVLRTKKWMEEFVRCTISLLCYATDTHNETI